MGRGPWVTLPAQEVAGAAHTPRALGRLPAGSNKGSGEGLSVRAGPVGPRAQRARGR